MRRNCWFLVPGFGRKFGGLINIVLKKAKLIDSLKGYRASALTTNFMFDIDQIKEELLKSGKIDKKSQLLNMYDFYMGSDSTDKHSFPFITHDVEESGMELEFIKKYNGYRVYNNGLYIKYKGYTSKKQLKFIDYFDECRMRVKKEEYDSLGYLRKVTYYNSSTSVIKNEMFYSRTGNCFLTKWYKHNEEEAILERINWFDVDGKLKECFSTEIELFNFWISTLIDDESENFLISDKRVLDYNILDFPQMENVYKIISHHGHTFPKFSSVFRNAPNVADATVFLTNGYKNDVEEKFGKKDNYFVIPNPCPSINSANLFEERNLRKVITLARFDKGKRIDHAIKAFSKIVKVIPDAFLEIYGFGNEQKNLESLIVKLGLENNVFIKGFTENVGELYETAALSLFTSQSEGMGLVILESLAHGCPVISYDIKYGPSDLIRNGNNGYLINDEEIDELAAKTIELLRDKQQLKEFSDKARENLSDYFIENYVPKWIALMDYVVENRKTKEYIETLKIKSFQIKKEENNQYSIYLKLNRFETEEINKVEYTIQSSNSVTSFILDKGNLNSSEINLKFDVNINNFYPNAVISVIFKYGNSFVEYKLCNLETKLEVENFI